MFNKEIFKKGFFRSSFVGSVVGFILVTIIILGGKGYANIAENKAVQECKTNGYSELMTAGTIEPSEISEAEFVNNCETIENRVQDILTEFGIEKGAFDVYITDSSNDILGDEANARVISFQNINENIDPIMNISYQADYEFTLRETVAHEYVHVLTSNAEREWLATHPGIWEDNSIFAVAGEMDPVEAAADCGSPYFTKHEHKDGAYKIACTPEQTKIAYAIIENTLVK